MSFRIISPRCKHSFAIGRLLSRVSPFRKMAKKMFRTNDDGAVPGNQLRILKYPHAKVGT
jgi:hypothetical protein